MTASQQLSQTATRLLRSHGFTAAGRPRHEVKTEQCRFEDGLIRTPMLSQSQRPRKGQQYQKH